MRKPVNILVGLVFTVIGLVFLGIGWKSYQSQKAFLSNAVRTQGKVTQLNLVNKNRKGKTKKGTYYPTIEFQNTRGETFTFQANVGSTPPAYDLGEQVDILYNPNSPSEAQLTGFWNLWGLSTIFAGFGLLLLTVSAVIVIRRRTYP